MLGFNHSLTTRTPETLTADQPAIRLDGIHKSYKTSAGEFPVLKGIDLEFQRGEFVGVIGKSGSGKSTLINMITGIDRPTSGEIFVGDAPVHTFTENQMSIWRGRNLGIVFQFFQLLPMLSLLENVMLPMDFCNMYPRAERKPRALELLARVEMQDHAHKLPSAISGGQQQRVAIARALANDPPIVIADEPTGNLDSRTAESVFRMFEELTGQGKTVVMVTHDSGLARRVSRTVLIADGEVVNEWVAKALPTLSPAQMVAARHDMRAQTFQPGQTIIHQASDSDWFYIILEGEVEVTLPRAGATDVVVARMGPGQYFGEIEVLRDRLAIASVRAGLSPVSVLVMDRPTLMRLLEESDSTRDALESKVNERLRENASAQQRKA